MSHLETLILWFEYLPRPRHGFNFDTIDTVSALRSRCQALRHVEIPAFTVVPAFDFLTLRATRPWELGCRLEFGRNSAHMPLFKRGVRKTERLGNSWKIY